MKLSTSLLLTGLIVLNTNVIAQKDTASTDLFDMSFEKLLEQAVSTASKRAEKINETPNVMHLITKQQINSRGYRNLRDVLSDIPGFNVLHKDLQYVSQIRGIAPNDNEKVSLMINGVIISSVTEDNYLTDLINMDNISKIEIIIGPGSVLYGSKSLCAIINLITNETEKTEVTVGVGNYNHNAVTLSKGAKFEDGNFFVSATRVQSNGWNALRNAPSSTGFDLLKGTDLLGKLYPSYSLFGKANFRNWEIQFSSLNSSTPELYVHKSGSYVKGNRDEEQDNMTIRNTQKWTYHFSTELLASYNNKRVLRATTQNDTISGVQSSFDLSQKEYDIDYSLKYDKEKNYFQMGIQYCYFQNRHNYIFDWFPNNPTATNSYVNSIVDIKDTYSYGLYISDTYKPTDKISLTGALRIDCNSILDNNKFYVSPRFAFIYSPSKLFTTKLMYNTATRMPSPWMSPLNEVWNIDKYSNASESWLLNPTAEKPEILTAYESQNIFKFGNTILSFNLYYQELNNFIAWFSPFTNTGNFSGKGAEMTFMSEINSNLKLWANASYNDAEFDNTALSNNSYGLAKTIANDKGEMMSVPFFTANIGTDLHYRKFYFSPRIKYLYHMPAYDALNSSFFYIENRAYLNATLSWANIMDKNITIQLIGKNITNNIDILPMQFQSMTYNPQGVNFEVVLNYKF